jgi:5-methylcytosine-specific restriction endonuclease McrA
MSEKLIDFERFRIVPCDHEELCRDYGPHPGGHYCKVTCVKCRRFIKWEGKPKDYCELCLSMKEDLVLPDTLEIHHVLEVQHGGSDDPENLQTLCTGCHRMVHWRRTYNRHSSFESQIERLRDEPSP